MIERFMGEDLAVKVSSTPDRPLVALVLIMYELAHGLKFKWLVSRALRKPKMGRE